MDTSFRRVLIGDKLATSQAIHQRLSKAKALAVFSSDALSSTAYATEAIMLVLAAAGSAALGVSLPIAIGIAALMLLVASSYYQTIHAYPNGGGANELVVACVDDRLDLHDLVRQLRARGCARIFVEGGGVTVSAFLEAGLLDRLHIAVAPLLIGEGRPAIRMAPRRLLKDCMKVQPRIYRTGEDVLFDCDLRANTAAVSEKKPDAAEVARVS